MSEYSEGEDLFADGFEKDYKESKYLDVYDLSDLDDTQEADELDEAEKRKVDELLNKRDYFEAKGLKAQDGQPEDLVLKRRRRRRADVTMNAEEEEYDPTLLDPDFVLDDLKGKTVEEWVSLDQPRKHVAFRFKKFLLENCDAKIQRMCEENKSSIEIDFQELYRSQPILALWVADCPKLMLEIFNEVSWELVKERFEYYESIVKTDQVQVRIMHLPTCEELRDLRHFHTNRLIRVRGVVTKRSAVLPEIRFVSYSCLQCQHQMTYYQQQNGALPPRPLNCSSCGQKGPFKIVSVNSLYRDYQKITLQESPNKVPPGRLPRHKDVILQGDLVDCCKPGEEIDITGIYINIYDVQLNVNNGFPLFQTVIEANHVLKKGDEILKVTNEEREKIIEMSRDPRIGKKIIKSIAPSIYGHEDVKTAIALSLFGGVAKNIQNKMRLRGDINVLLMGDPGTAKSQFLKYVEKTSSRAVYTTGQGASAVGLTASVFRSPVTREWTLEGGALVLADEGVCLIDEFDKMNDQDRTSIHEAMEQQSISVSKAGIVCSLQARCAVIAAANPIGGRYNPMKTFQENVNLTEPILSRFDVLCVVRDTIDLERDEKLARFVVENHLKSHPDEANANETAQDTNKKPQDLIDQRMLRLYIEYSKQNCSPRLQQMDQDKLAQVYSQLRRESLNYGSIPLTVRHVESMIRMAEAHARMHLRQEVLQYDLDVSISVMLKSFISANKASISKQLKKKFVRYLASGQDYDDLMMHLLNELANENFRISLMKQEQSDKVYFGVDEFCVKAREVGVEGEAFLDSEGFKRTDYAIEEIIEKGRRKRVISKRINN